MQFSSDDNTIEAAKIGIVDRIEGDVVVVEVQGEYMEFDISLFKNGVEEGSVVNLSTFQIDKSQTVKKKDNVNNMLKGLFRRNGENGER